MPTIYLPDSRPQSHNQCALTHVTPSCEDQQRLHQVQPGSVCHTLCLSWYQSSRDIWIQSTVSDWRANKGRDAGGWSYSTALLIIHCGCLFKTEKKWQSFLLMPRLAISIHPDQVSQKKKIATTRFTGPFNNWAYSSWLCSTPATA